MPDAQQLLLFAAAGLLLNLTPGPDVLYIVSSALRAFVPQFIAPGAAHPALAFVALGILFNINSIAVNAGWALAAAWTARRAAVQRGMRWLDRAAGLMFVAFGLKLALSDHPTH
jgi:threonine/homoserine/homoserine lactone efflux protein